MSASRFSAILLVCLLATAAGAQVAITSTQPAIIGFVDISGVPGAVQLTGIFDDSVTVVPAGQITIGNSLFPAGAVSISNNGVIVGGPNGSVGFTNTPIPSPTGVPSGIYTGGPGILMPFWDDLYPSTASPPTQIWYLNDTANSVAIFMWKDENHYFSSVAGEGITFEAQVFQGANCSLGIIQYLYSDVIFGGTMAVNDNGASATVGYGEGTINAGGNAQFSVDTPTLAAGMCITMYGTGNSNALALTASSPFGNGSLQIDITGGPCGGGPYFMPVTLNAGNFPNGWLFGLDMTFGELATEINGGFPFSGSLNALGAITIGPFGGVPSGLTFYAVAMNVVAPGYPGTVTPPMTYSIP